MQHLTLGTGKWAGTKFGDRAMAWQRRGVYAVLGPAPTSPEEKHWVSTWFIEAGKKQAKSAFAALFTLAYVLAFPEADGRYYLLASNKMSASLLYDPLQAAILNDPHLSKICNVRSYKRDVIVYETGQEIKCLALDLESTTGMVANFVAIDELHLITKNRRGQHMLGQLWSGLSVTGGMSLVTTTKPLPGETMAGVYSSLRNRAVAIIGGESSRDESLLPTIFEPLPDTDISTSFGLTDALWRANPSMGTTVTEAWLRQQYDIATASMDVTDLDIYRSQHLNQFVEGSAAGIDGWPPAREWTTWTDPTLTFDRFLSESTETFAGVDAGGHDDLSAIVLLGRTAEGRMLVWSRAWLTRHGYETWPRNQPLYLEAEQAGELTLTDAPGEDLDGMLDLLQSIPGLRAVGVDPYGLESLVTELSTAGVSAVGISQGFKISPHLEAAEREYFSGNVRHPNHPLLRWCVANMRLKDRGGAKAITKPAGEQQGAEKIDLAVALVMSFAVRTSAPVPFDTAAMVG